MTTDSMLPVRLTPSLCGRRTTVTLTIAGLLIFDPLTRACAADVSDSAGLSPATLEEVIVTGTHLESGATGPLPVQVYDRSSISQSGQSTLADFLNTLPDASIANGESDDQNVAGRTTVQLHGLPAGTTLVLIDGQRIARSDYGFFDLGNIPVAAVERVDVVPVGASAVYGSDALAGAVNIILRKDIEGLDISARYGGASGTRETNAALSMGHSWEQGGVTGVFNYQYRDGLVGSQRVATSTTAVPADAPYGEVVQTCNPGTVYSLTGANLPGLNSPSAAIPPGLTGTPRVADFAATAGQVNHCSSSLQATLIPPTKRYGLLLSGHYDAFEHGQLFANVLASKRMQSFNIGNYGNVINLDPSAFTLGAANPFNPFGQDVAIGYTYPGLAQPLRNDQYFVRSLVGIRGRLSGAWTYEVTAQLSHEHSSVLEPGFGADPTLIQGALNATTPDQALNPFSSGAPGSNALLNAIAGSAPPTSGSDDARGTSAQMLARGPLVSLPAGDLQVVVGSEVSHDTQSTNAGYGSSTVNVRRTSYAAFNEDRIPVLAGWNHVPQAAALTLAARYDHSNDFGGKFTWQSGLEVHPGTGWLFRAAYATAYQAPQLQQTAGGAFTFPSSGYVDPFRNQEPVSVPTTFGPNPHLKPETGQSRTVGIQYGDLSTQAGLHADLTWYALRLEQYIFQPDIQVLINNPGLFPGGVVRSAPNAQDVAAGLPGAIVQLNDLYYNYGDLSVRGLDADVSDSLSTQWGVFHPLISASYHYRWDATVTPGAPTVSYLGQATRNGPGFAPRWKGTVGLGWSLSNISANLTGRYIGRYRDYQDEVPNTNQLGNDWYLDAYVRYEIGGASIFPNHSAAKSYVEFGAVNLTDRLPRYSYFGQTGYDPAQSDIRGRFVYIGVGAHW